MQSALNYGRTKKRKYNTQFLRSWTFYTANNMETSASPWNASISTCSHSIVAEKLFLKWESAVKVGKQQNEDIKLSNDKNHPDLVHVEEGTTFSTTEKAQSASSWMQKKEITTFFYPFSFMPNYSRRVLAA